MKHYVVFYGRTCGIFDSWDTVKASTSGYPGNKFKCHEYKGGWTPEEYSPAYKRRMAEARRHLIQLQSAPSKEGLPTKPNYITGFPS